MKCEQDLHPPAIPSVDSMSNVVDAFGGQCNSVAYANQHITELAAKPLPETGVQVFVIYYM